MCHYDENTELELEPQEDAGRPGDNLSNLRSRLEDLALSRPPNSDEDHGDGLTLPPSPPVDDFNLDEEHSCEATTTSSDEFGSSNRPFPARSVSVPPQGHRTGDNIDSASAKSEPWGGRTFQDRLSSASSVLPSELNNEERQILIPPLDGKGQFGRWPMERLPVSDSGQFLEGDQWWSTGVHLGEGASGQCFTASLITESIKKTATETISQNEEEKDQAVSLDKETDVFCCKYCQVEVNILLEASRKNILQIVTFYGAAIYKRDVCIFMELMCGSVAFLYKEEYEAPLPEHLYIPFTTDILKAVEFMHGNGFIHNDIKGANVLVDDKGRTAKLTDFGSASSSENKVLNSSFEDDIWLVGCFILEMMNAERPCCAMLKSGRQQRDFTENIPQGDNQITHAVARGFFYFSKRKDWDGC
ncbi:predicted protein [Nematostella vectensis]|uniref:Protein kinase domain-containing protein n=1 Tax=Nematostella vectensis TaxID=45351 RepID=A7S149_NEMVE|nr:predicted protein [Nematostella vectensis]|eukprot:XP_001634639.1 predicted protein [Nematostella vectensis]